jgi:peroxiredoxin Q/BCP
MRTHVLLALPLVLGACGKDHDSAPQTAATATAPSTELQVGKPAPSFDVTASDGARLKLSELRGKPVVLYFYPRDETPGCTKEACSFRDGWDLQKNGVVMIGVSMDDDASHNAFADHYKLPFHLVSDPDGSLAHAYGVPISDDPKSGKTTDRQTIVISRDGDVKQIYRTVNVNVHAAQLQADVTS